MKRLRAIIIVGLLLAVALPASAEDYRSGAGIAYTSGVLDIDVPFFEALDFVGYTLFWKHGFDDQWGLLVSYRDMEDDEFLLGGEEDEYQQIGVHAVIMWRHGKTVRPHVKFGLVQTDFEATDSSGTIDDDDTTLSIGGGLEAGSESFAFFADYDYTQPEIFGRDFDIWNVSLGVIFKY